jgi:hypothetical protein
MSRAISINTLRKRMPEVKLNKYRCFEDITVPHCSGREITFFGKQPGNLIPLTKSAMTSI